MIFIFQDKMKKSLIAILIVGMAFSISLPTVNATLSVWGNTPKTSADIGEIFELRFKIMADETANYSITLV